MNNLTQIQRGAKEEYLTNQSEQMLKMYDVADSKERQAVANHIYGFLPIVSEYEKAFWLKFLNELEKINEKPKELFSLGQVFLTVGAKEALAESGQFPNEFLEKHQSGDWGTVCESDSKENNFSVENGFRILSAYKTAQGIKIWLITESDRSITTILLPDEY